MHKKTILRALLNFLNFQRILFGQGMTKLFSCWCGNSSLEYFSQDYSICNACSTLISQMGLSPEQTLVKNDEEDFYGKNYWLGHQQNALGFPNIFKRSRLDLSERCLHWLKTILKYKFPPAKVLEIGCSHGGFVSILRQCGYDAMGLELSPWVADFAKKSFNIPILVGPIEEQHIEASSLDLIILMDVFEHLPNPLFTIKSCLKLLKEDGILVIQTPCFPSEKTYKIMVEENSPFLSVMKKDEHLYLFSQESVKKFFKNILKDIELQFEPAIFAIYDMFFIVGRKPLTINSESQIENFLSSSPQTRLIQAMLDMYSDLNQKTQSISRLTEEIKIIEADRAERLKIINFLDDECNKLKQEICRLNDKKSFLKRLFYENRD